MDVMGIAVTSVDMSGARLMTEVSAAVMDKGLETAEAQGEALQEMMDAVPWAGGRLLDVYA